MDGFSSKTGHLRLYSQGLHLVMESKAEERVEMSRYEAGQLRDWLTKWLGEPVEAQIGLGEETAPPPASALGEMHRAKGSAWDEDHENDARLPRPGSQKSKILRELRKGAATREQLSERLGIPGNSVRPAVIELAGAGFIEPHPDYVGQKPEYLWLSQHTRELLQEGAVV